MAPEPASRTTTSTWQHMLAQTSGLSRAAKSALVQLEGFVLTSARAVRYLTSRQIRTSFLCRQPAFQPAARLASAIRFPQLPTSGFSSARVRRPSARRKAHFICAAMAARPTIAPTSTPMAAPRGPLSRRRDEHGSTVCRLRGCERERQPVWSRWRRRDRRKRCAASRARSLLWFDRYTARHRRRVSEQGAVGSGGPLQDHRSADGQISSWRAYHGRGSLRDAYRERHV